ncbi:hypothetical protein EV678_2297 [Azospira oryzae]|uniref:Uncharacterized protein n=1 Tax=Azospira oryzae TaxID=146939 RepID=A0ABY0IMH9_9RHOO|nr:HAD domain-containing protein [Azospira oryzae]RZT76421.1 hypothetical protein EV678_2297 [Azospira oryzae]
MILFLDIDGVLHPVFPREDLPDEENQLLSYLPRLESVLREYSFLQIVVASDWRRRIAFDELRNIFTEDLRNRLIGITPTLEKMGDGWIGHRQREALQYLETQNLADEMWIALDDDPDNWLPDAPLVLCNDGFRTTEEAILRNLLNKFR